MVTETDLELPDGRTLHVYDTAARDEVRSLILPKNGFPTIASREPIPVTTDRLFGARSIPTSEFI